MRDWDLVRDPLLALQDGDPEPFEAFVRLATRGLVGFFRRQGAGLQRAEDLTQEVFLKLYRHAPRYRPQERFAAFAFRVARNLWVDDQRRRAARPRLAGARPGEERDVADLMEAVPSDAPSPETRFVLREELGRLRDALRGLSEAHRQVFELGVMQELSYAEIGALLEIPVGTVKSRMFHVVRRLREALEERE